MLLSLDRIGYEDGSVKKKIYFFVLLKKHVGTSASSVTKWHVLILMGVFCLTSYASNGHAQAL